MNTARRGFTSHSTWMPVIIVGLLIAIAIPNLLKTGRRAMQRGLTRDLEQLSAAQGEHYRRFRTYASTFREGAERGALAFTPRGGNDVRITRADSGGWSAIASRRAYGLQMQCGIEEGAVGVSAGAAAMPGTVSCR